MAYKEQMMYDLITPRNVFTAAYRHFVLADNKPARDSSGCKYLTDDGRKCAIGLVIPDGHPAQQVIGGVNELWEIYRDLFPANLSSADLDTLFSLQSELHDHMCNNNGNWSAGHDRQEARKYVYERVAEQFNLEIPKE